MEPKYNFKNVIRSRRPDALSSQRYEYPIGLNVIKGMLSIRLSARLLKVKKKREVGQAPRVHGGLDVCSSRSVRFPGVSVTPPS